MKTLKDFYKIKNALFANAREKNKGFSIDSEDLKQEAIKIIKLSHNHYEFIKEFPFKILNDRERTVIREFVKWQNNISKEDLENA